MPRIATALLFTAFALPAPAQSDPPVIDTAFAGRGLIVESHTEGPNGFEEAEHTTELSGPFLRIAHTSLIGDQGSTASGSGHYDSNIGIFAISEHGHADTMASTGSADGYSEQSATNYSQITFSVPVEATFSLVGSMQASGSGPAGPFGIFGGKGRVSLRVQGSAPDGFPFIYQYDVTEEDTDPVEFAEVQTMRAGTSVTVTLSAGCGAVNEGPGTASSDFRYNYTLDFGDRDEDGLLDAWETDGIDLDGDGTPEIDLPAMGADPNKKNLFVELDSITGINVDLAAIAMVEEAFARAPASLIDNPDGTDGVTLKIIVDESNLINVAYDGNGWPPEFDAAKSIHFGTPPLRADADRWNVLKDIYKLIFRYCVWGDCIFYNRESDGTAVDFSGKGELPGNDFFVAGGAVASWYADPTLRTNALAATLMHELGHNLSLHHGGQEDSPNYKTNYLSVMNYAYQLPMKSTAADDAWHLDYARTTPRTINELNTHEDRGLDGPAGLKIIFNTSANGFDPVLQIADANAPEIDWNLSGPPIETGITTVDLNRFNGTQDSYQVRLEPFTDWDRIWYHLSGSSDFADGSHASVAAIEPFTFDDFQAINSYVVHDHSTSPCTADMNADGILDIGDVSAFVALFIASDPAADTNNDGILDIGDVSTFVTLFLDGC